MVELERQESRSSDMESKYAGRANVNLHETWLKWNSWVQTPNILPTFNNHFLNFLYSNFSFLTGRPVMVSRRFCQEDVLSGRRFVRTAIDVLSIRHLVRIQQYLGTTLATLGHYLLNTFARLGHCLHTTGTSWAPIGHYLGNTWPQLGDNWALLWHYFDNTWASLKRYIDTCALLGK